MNFKNAECDFDKSWKFHFFLSPYLDHILTWYDSLLFRVTRPSLTNHPSLSKVSHESVSVHFNKAYVCMLTILALISEVTSLRPKEEMGKACVFRCVWGSMRSRKLITNDSIGTILDTAYFTYLKNSHNTAS